MRHSIIESLREYLTVDYEIDDLGLLENDLKFNEPPHREIHVVYYRNFSGFIMGTVVWLEPLENLNISNEWQYLPPIGMEC
jgi:hypothetical protein